MRLIDVTTMRLREFGGEEIPPYAILSHVWGEGEVTTDDLHASYAQYIPGFQKIQYLCTQARQDGLQFAWCDTCCIDKSSSAELSESINSMFKWYQDAKVCYAYLADVSNASPGQFEDEFACSRWFRRGWTLQELIAPQRVVFYGKGWIQLGKKANLTDEITDITGIPEAVLVWPWTIQSYSIARRMSWASNRKTTRVEDEAYSLMGILRVHMPLVYGEGRSAFQRLQEELIKSSDDESIFIHSGFNILADRPVAFRDSERIVSLKHIESSRPFTMTNRGVQIELRLLRGREVQGTDSKPLVYGIFNCHSKGNYKNYYAIPLHPTESSDTFVRAIGAPLPMTEEEAICGESRNIYIGLKPQQRTTIPCLLKCDSFQTYGYTLDCHMEDFPCTWYDKGRLMTLHLNPKSSFHWACMAFSFDNSKAEQAFDSFVFFDFARDKTGVAIHQRIDSKNHLQSKFEMWKSSGYPEECTIELDMEAGGHVRKVKVIATLRRETMLNESVLVLDVLLNSVD